MILAFIVSCSALPVKKPLMFNEVIFSNASDTQLENVRVEVKKTTAYFSCSILVKHGICSTSFPPKVYQGNSIYISWKIEGKEKVVGPLHIQLPPIIREDTPARVVIRFNSENNISAKFVY
ncbi:MAG: hypothetical protein JKX87_05810 [Cycloclasticus sp.]|nr:hypothetical protein [Cycloclasticus sp.]